MTTTEIKSDTEVPSAADVQAVLAIVATATMAKPPSPPSTIWEKRVERWQGVIGILVLAIMITILTLAGLAVPVKVKLLYEVAMILLNLMLLLCYLMCFGISLVGISFLWRLATNPYALFLQHVDLVSQFDHPSVDALNQCRKNALQYVLTHYKYQRLGYERRAGMIAGAIEKVGLLPALAGLIILLSNLSKAGVTIGLSDFIGPVLLSFYGIGVLSAHMTHRMDRVIALLEYSLQLKK